MLSICQDLGTAGLTRRPTSVVLVLPVSSATGPMVVKEGDKAEDPKQVQADFDNVQRQITALLEEWLEAKDK